LAAIACRANPVGETHRREVRVYSRFHPPDNAAITASGTISLPTPAFLNREVIRFARPDLLGMAAIGLSSMTSVVGTLAAPTASAVADLVLGAPASSSSDPDDSVLTEPAADQVHWKHRSTIAAE
jgi:hypothetical protein